MLDDLNLDALSDLGEPLFGIAEFLMTNFFLPRTSSPHTTPSVSSTQANRFQQILASTNKTPQPSPAHHAALQHVLSQEEQQRLEDFVGTPERLSSLRETCLLRDRHRCVISRAFDMAEATTRFRERSPAADDDGIPLLDSDNYQYVEVAHIIPYHLTKADDGQLNEVKKAAISVLNIFDRGVVHLIEGADINRPYNAITLSLEMHKRFGKYEVFFEGMVADDAFSPPTPTVSAPFSLPHSRTHCQ